MISVSAALDALFALATPLPVETVPLTDAAGRVLAKPVHATRDQPPFAASAMDGYATRSGTAQTTLTVIGESAAGHAFDGDVTPGTAVRIFTGAPLPQGADRVVIQEDVTRDGDRITLTEDTGEGANIRPAANDFAAGDVLQAPRRLTPSDVALLASMNAAEIQVHRRPKVALIATGDELVAPGGTPNRAQIIASNSYGLQAMFRDAGAEVALLPIAKDTLTSLAFTLDLAAEADVTVTIGGASVGDHDLVAKATAQAGMTPAFHKVAMRPGKPLMSGRLGQSILIGLPGNPVSALVCGHVFVRPVLDALSGLPPSPAPRKSAILAAPLPKNGPREHYMRASLSTDGLRAFDRQDSSLLTVLSNANALIARPPHDPARQAGDIVTYLPFA